MLMSSRVPYVVFAVCFMPLSYVRLYLLPVCACVWNIFNMLSLKYLSDFCQTYTLMHFGTEYSIGILYSVVFIIKHFIIKQQLR